jgi:6-pyruvoyltetrahydropterin/6-carboxytetrahydropterin synthase
MSSLSKRNYLDSPVKKRKTIKNEDMTNSLHDDDVNPIESSKNTAINEAEFDIFVSKSDFKFNCAHFIAYKGFRERLHGHNYRISIKVTGKSGGILSEDGYLIDFGDIKVAARDICKSLNEFFICPMKSDAIEIKDIDNSLCLTCEDGAKFVFPKTDCAQLPIYHSSAEEISHYIYCEVIRYRYIKYFFSMFLIPCYCPIGK